MRSDHHAGRTWGKRGATPIVETTGARHRMSLISAITARGHMRFMIKEKGGVNAAVFIEFLKRLIAGAKRAIFLIVDRGPAHIAKKTRAFVDSQHGRLRLFFLPPYSPDRNPDELVWKHLKADTVGRMTITDKADFKAKVRASMRQLQNDPAGSPSHDKCSRRSCSSSRNCGRSRHQRQGPAPLRAEAPVRVVFNWDEIAGNWKQFTGKARQQWGKLTDDDLEVARGQREELVGKIQERYGITKERRKRTGKLTPGLSRSILEPSA